VKTAFAVSNKLSFLGRFSQATRHLLPDALGSTMALTDTAGNVKTSYTYEPFGKTTASGQTSTNSFKYTGREDDGTGLYYFRARYYHPTLHRFISEDPLEFGGGDVNLYVWGWGSQPSGPIGRSPWPTS
jgi:RHS repeat-associated protein